MSDLHETDILTWSERQADLLRRLASGERVNDQVDWQNVAEVVESVGCSKLHRTESLLIQALRHPLKILAWPQSSEVPHRQEAATICQLDAERAFQESMRQRLDLAWIYRRACHPFPERMDGQPGLPLPGTCTFSLDELLGRDR